MYIKLRKYAFIFKKANLKLVFVLIIRCRVIFCSCELLFHLIFFIFVSIIIHREIKLKIYETFNFYFIICHYILALRPQSLQTSDVDLPQYSYTRDDIELQYTMDGFLIPLPQPNLYQD